jgi:TPR repeat protein
MDANETDADETDDASRLNLLEQYISEKRYIEARALLERAGNSLSNSEKLQLAYLYEDGTGGGVNRQQARLLKESVHQDGDMRGTVGLAEWYEREGDHEKTLQFYSLAADSGYVYAMYWYSRYLRKRGDSKQADEYLVGAKDGGYPRALSEFYRLRIQHAPTAGKAFIARVQFWLVIPKLVWVAFSHSEHTRRRY